MAIGTTAYIEFSTDSFETLVNCRAATPGGIFLWHTEFLLGLLGMTELPSGRRHPFALRGTPKSLSQSLVRDHCLVISTDTPDTLAEKKASRKFSNQDVVKWKREGLQICPLDNPNAYEFQLCDDDLLILNPGCELPSWATATELRSYLNVIREESDGRVWSNADQYNQSVFDWIDALENIYGASNVRLVYWFDSVPQERLLRYQDPLQ